MKTRFLLAIILFICYFNVASSQTLDVRIIYGDTDSPIEDVLVNNKKILLPTGVSDIRKFKVKTSNLPTNHKLIFEVGGESKTYTSSGQEMSFTNNIVDKEIVVKHIKETGEEVGEDKVNFRFVPDDEVADGPPSTTVISPSIDDFVRRKYSDLIPTPFGLRDKNDKDRIVHIFFDYLGNSLLSTVPQGISNAQYMVHIVYPVLSSDPNSVSYSIIQKSGSFNSGLLFNNANILSQTPGTLQSGKVYDLVVERVFLLGTSTDDLSFDIVSKEGGKRTVLESYQIKMSPLYHGSFDIGLLRTELSNPTFNLVDLPGGTDKVVKLTDDSPKGVVSVMASFYVSPVILLEHLVGSVSPRVKRVPFYKLSGRNFLDDHKIYERFYPTVGVRLNNKVFENIFYGINWEIARGLSVFGGWHYGKVRTFEMPNFDAGVTPVTEKQFEFFQNSRWRTSTAMGVKLDILIIRNLFGAASGN